MLIEELLLFFLFIFIQKICTNNATKCGKYSIESLQVEISYKSYFNDKEPLKIKVERNNEQTKVLIGYFTSADGVIHCVGVKFYSGREAGDESLFRNSIKTMERIQQSLPEMERKHLITMIDAGITTPYGERIIIMEMGVDSFHDRLYDRLAVQYDSDEHMVNAIRGLARPLVEFHNIAIHMDVNPRNYLYVEKDGHLVVKLIDFEGAKLVSTSNKNECVVIGEEHALSPEYTGPEYYGEQSQAISTKFDIWSMGIMLIEIAFDQFRAQQRETPLIEDERKSRLFAIGNLYLGFTRNRLGTQPGIFKETQIVYSAGTEWIEQHQSAIETVLHIWMKYPKTALLVTNLLNLERKKRLTAQGILNYIDGLCQIGEFKEVKTSKKLRIFNSLNFGDFLTNLRVTKWKNKFNFLKENRSELDKSYKNLKKILKKVIKKQRKEMKRLKREGTANLNDCETE